MRGWICRDYHVFCLLSVTSLVSSRWEPQLRRLIFTSLIWILNIVETRYELITMLIAQIIAN